MRWKGTILLTNRLPSIPGLLLRQKAQKLLSLLRLRLTVLLDDTCCLCSGLDSQSCWDDTCCLCSGLDSQSCWDDTCCLCSGLDSQSCEMTHAVSAQAQTHSLVVKTHAVPAQASTHSLVGMTHGCVQVCSLAASIRGLLQWTARCATHRLPS